jgi:hypothetical protein
MRIKLSKCHSWAMPDYSVTSGTGLTLIPECRLSVKIPMSGDLFSGIPAFIYMIFQHSAYVYSTYLSVSP